MAEPSADHIGFDASFEEANCRRVSKHMWRYRRALLPRPGSDQVLRVPLDEFVDTKACELLVPIGDKQRALRVAGLNRFQLPEQCSSLWPNRTSTPFISLAMQPRA